MYIEAIAINKISQLTSHPLQYNTSIAMDFFYTNAFDLDHFFWLVTFLSFVKMLNT